MTELPLVIVNFQRGGPSTGLPTKTEQSDLYQAVYGRNGDAPIAVHRRAQPGRLLRCRDRGVRLATQFMTPVILLTDGYIANAAEPWKVPDMATYEPFPVEFFERGAGRGQRQAVSSAIAERCGASWIKPGHAGPDAPHRRHRERLRHRRHRL